MDGQIESQNLTVGIVDDRLVLVALADRGLGGRRVGKHRRAQSGARDLVISEIGGSRHLSGLDGDCGGASRKVRFRASQAGRPPQRCRYLVRGC